MGIREKIVFNTMILNRKMIQGGLLRWFSDTPWKGAF